MYTDSNQDPLEAFQEAMEKIMPVLEGKARRVGGATFQVPTEIRPDRKESIRIEACCSSLHSGDCHSGQHGCCFDSLLLWAFHYRE